MPRGTTRLPRVEGLGWMMLYVAGALVFLRAFLGPELRLPGTLLTLAIAISTAVVVAAVRAPWTLRRLQARWICDGPVHALEDTTVGAELSAPRGIGPFSLEAWNPTTRRFDQVLRLKGLGRQEIRPTWSVRFPRRGILRLPPLVARCDQPFGLISAGRELGEPGEVLVLPAVGSTKKGLHTRLRSYLETFATTSADSGDDELAQLRAYRPGDAPIRSTGAPARARAPCWWPSARRWADGSWHWWSTAAPKARARALNACSAPQPPWWSSSRWSSGGISLHGAFFPAGVRGRPARLLEALALATSDPRPVSDFIPPGMPALVLCLREVVLSGAEPRPLALTLPEVEELVHIPSRVR